MKKNIIKSLSLVVFLSCFICACVSSKSVVKTDKNTDTNKSTSSDLSTSSFEPFYVYENFQSPKNHYTPSGWMGDVANIELDQSYTQETHSGNSCIGIKFTIGGLKQWSGIYWQHPENNWGDKNGGYNITGATKLTFWARGANGYEVISEVKIGGIPGTFGDSDVAWLKGIKLTGSWKQYTIDLSKSDLSSISGGFCIVLAKKDNPKGCTIFLDDIRYE